MAHFQRVPFELLPPEQQQELLDKQLSYKKQREMLLQQMEEKKRTKNEPKKRARRVEDEDEEPPYQGSSYQQQPMYTQNHDNLENFVLPPLQNLSVTLPQQKPLLTDRPKPQKTTFNGAATFTPTQIKDSFTNLRHQIRSSAANAVINSGTLPQSARNRHTASFNETGYFHY